MDNIKEFVPDDNRELFLEKIRPYLDKLLVNIGYNPGEFSYETTSSNEFIERYAKMLNEDSTETNYYQLQDAIHAASKTYRVAYADAYANKITIFTNRLNSSLYEIEEDLDKRIKCYLTDIVQNVTEIGRNRPDNTTISWLHEGNIYGYPSGLAEWIKCKWDEMHKVIKQLDDFGIGFFVIDRKALSIEMVREMIVDDMEDLSWYDIARALSDFYLEEGGLLIDEINVNDHLVSNVCVFVDPTMDNLDALYRLVDVDSNMERLDRFDNVVHYDPVNLKKLNELLDEFEDQENVNNSGKDEDTK